MKVIKLLSLFTMTALIISSCGEKKSEEKKDGEKTEKSDKDNSTSENTPLEGAWEIKRATGEMASMNIGVIYEFKGTALTFGSASYKNPGTTVVTENTFSFQADGSDLQFMYDYKLEGDTLVVSMQNSGQTFYMVKQ